MAAAIDTDRDVDLFTPYRESVLSTRSMSYVSHASTTTMSCHTDSDAGAEAEVMDVDNNDNNTINTDNAAILPTNADSQPLPASVAHSLLFELPFELREKIYSLVLAIPEDRNIEWPTPCKRRSFNLQPALLRTCKIILSEAAPLLYTLNNFEWTHPSDANIFVRAFASPKCARMIARVRLDLRASDMRLWMPYLTSTDEVRSLRADFPNMRELSVRYQSLKWAGSRSPEDNLKTWIDDTKLDEMMRGLRSVFPSKVTDDFNDYDMGIGDQEFREYLQQNPVNFDDPNETMQFRARLHEAHKIHHAEKMRVAREHAAALRKRYVSVPTIRVTCACRVPEEHFTHLTSPTPATAPPATTEGGEPAPEPVLPVEEGEAFRGFTAVDFHNYIMRNIEPDVGTVGVALTPFTDRHGVLLALEIDFNEPRAVQID